MTTNRLTADPRHAFAGVGIDRKIPLRFRLDGYEIEGFVGDTVLSAALAAGVVGVGRHNGFTMALTPGFAPPVRPANQPAHLAKPVPMDRAPALAGQDLVTEGAPFGFWPRRALNRLKKRDRHTLGLVLGGATAPWRAEIGGECAKTHETDLVVIGGGVAGLSASLAGARAGLSVLLVERRTVLGGDAVLFGNRAGEDPSDVLIDRLTAELDGHDNVTVWTHAEADTDLSGTLLVHRPDPHAEQLSGHWYRIAAKYVVLAPGAADRLPLFGGNRLAGVNGLSTAFHLAHAFGVWPGRRAIIAGGVAPIYRMAMLAHDAGVAVGRVVDSRLDPHSRFIDFAKAYGLHFAAGSRIAGVTPERDDSLSVRLESVWADPGERHEVPIAADRLVVSDGFLPRLKLWQGLGGRCSISAETRCLEAGRGRKGVILAGSAAGYRGTKACAQSGEMAVARLLGQRAAKIADPALPDIYDSPGAPPMTEVLTASPAPAYLGKGISLGLANGPSPTPDDLDRVLALGGQTLLDPARIEALVRLKLLPAEAFAAVIAERVGPATALPAHPPDASENTLPDSESREYETVPPYLVGRFGPKPVLAEIAVDEMLAPGPGSLLYADFNTHRPFSAIGVVLGPGKKGTLALLDRAHTDQPKTLAVWENSRVSGARIVAIREVAS